MKISGFIVYLISDIFFAWFALFACSYLYGCTFLFNISIIDAILMNILFTAHASSIGSISMLVYVQTNPTTITYHLHPNSL